MTNDSGSASLAIRGSASRGSQRIALDPACKAVTGQVTVGGIAVAMRPRDRHGHSSALFTPAILWWAWVAS